MSAIDKQALRWFALQAERPLDPLERADLDDWLAQDSRHQGAFVRAAVIHHALRQAAGRLTLYPGEDRYQLRAPDDGAPPVPGRRLAWRYGAAALVLLALGAMVPHLTGGTTLATTKGEVRRVALADRSVATINSGSELKVRLTGSERQVALKRGEAWFQVAKDRSKPFIVEAGDVHARAVGTAFGVRRFAGGAEIMVTEGLVEVWADGGRATRKLLKAGERALVAERAADIKVTRQPAEVQRKLAWREGKVIFARQTLGDAVADFNRYSTRKIVIVDPAIRDKRIFGQYQTDAPEQFARDIGDYLNVPIVVTENEIKIGAPQLL